MTKQESLNTLQTYGDNAEHWMHTQLPHIHIMSLFTKSELTLTPFLKLTTIKHQHPDSNNLHCKHISPSKNRTHALSAPALQTPPSFCGVSSPRDTADSTDTGPFWTGTRSRAEPRAPGRECPRTAGSGRWASPVRDGGVRAASRTRLVLARSCRTGRRTGPERGRPAPAEYRPPLRPNRG